MKKIFVLIILAFFIVPAFALDNGNTGTAVSSSSVKYLSQGVEQITAYVDVKTVKGAPVPVIDGDVLKYMTSVGFVFNNEKTGALMVMETHTCAKKTLVNTDNPDDLEKEYKGF